MNNPDNRPVDAARDEPVTAAGEPVAQPAGAFPADPAQGSLGDAVPEPRPAEPGVDTGLASGQPEPVPGSDATPPSFADQRFQGEEFQGEQFQGERLDAQRPDAQYQPEQQQQQQQQQYEAGQYQRSQYAAGGYPPEQYPGGQFPAEQYPAGEYPAEQYPAEQYPVAQYPAQQYPTQQYVGYPDQQYPAAQYPGEQYPGEQYPGEQYPGQQYPAQSDQEQAPSQVPVGQPGGAGPEPRSESLPGSGTAARPKKPSRPRTDESGAPYGVGPFSLREAVFLILAALVVVASFLPFIGGVYAELFGYSSLWAPAPWLAIPGALLLAAAAALIVIRRLQPQRRLRVGSLSVDQFASVAAVTTAGFYVGSLFLLLGFTAWFRPGALGGNLGGDNFDGLTPGAGLILGLIFSLASTVPTACAMFVPVFAEDFSRRAEIPAHPAAREAAAVPVRPRPVRHTAEHQPEVHHYGLEHSGSVQLTPADTRPEDFAAYRRSGWSPDSASDTDSAYAEFDAARGSVPGFLADGPGSSIPLTTQPPTGPAGATTDDSLLGDEIDEIQTGSEPAPVSAIRHVAEQESLGDVSSHDSHEQEPSAAPHHPSVPEPGSRTEFLPGAPQETGPERASEADAELTPELTSELQPEVAPGLAPELAPETEDELAPELAPEMEDELAPEMAPETGAELVPETVPGTVPNAHDGRVPDVVHTSSAQPAEPNSAGAPPTVVSTQPFWVYSPVPLAVVDEESGVPVFDIGPDAWALAIIDRGTELVIRHDDGRVGVLREITGIMRG